MAEIRIIAPDRRLHEQIRFYRHYPIEDFEQIRQMIAKCVRTETLLTIGALPQNFFRLPDIYRYLLNCLACTPPQDLTEIKIFPVKEIQQHYIEAKYRIIAHAMNEGLHLRINEEDGLDYLLMRFAYLSGTIDDEMLARYLGVICDHAFIGPEIVHLDLSNACNNDCIFCGYYSSEIANKLWKTKDWQKRMLPYEKFKEIAADFSEIRANRHIAIAGEGEPGTYPKIMEVLETFAQYKIGVGLYTNLLAFSLADLKRMVDIGTSAIIVNVSGASEESYCRLHPGKPASRYRRLIENLRKMVIYQKKLGKQHPEITLKHVLTSINYREIIALVEQCHSIGATHLYPELSHLICPDIEYLLLNREQIEEFKPLWEKAKELCGKYGIHLYDHINVQLGGMASEESRKLLRWTMDLYRERGCFVGWFFSRIYTDSTVGYCCRTKKIDDLADKSFQQSWNSPLYNEWRLRAKYFSDEAHQPHGNVLMLTSVCNQCGNFYTNNSYYQFFVDYGFLGFLRPARPPLVIPE